MEFYPYNLGMLFAERAKASGDRAALHYATGDISYARLVTQVGQLAAMLLDRGYARGDVIAIAHNKAALSYALMLAALRLGIAYVNIDTASPAVRNRLIIKTSGPRALFVDDPEHLLAMQELAGTCGMNAELLAEPALAPVAAADQRRQIAAMAEVDGASIAYIMFTSGSTGVPKEVAVTHQNVLHFIQWGIERFGIGSSDNFANLSPMYFDNSVFDFYVALFSGASLTPVPRRLLNAPAEQVSHVASMGCTIWFSVPSLLIYVATMKALTAASLPAIRCIIFGGEGYPKVELIKLWRMFGSRARLVNVYGPTECTCICSAHDLSDDDFEDMTGLPTLGPPEPEFRPSDPGRRRACNRSGRALPHRPQRGVRLFQRSWAHRSRLPDADRSCAFHEAHVPHRRSGAARDLRGGCFSSGAKTTRSSTWATGSNSRRSSTLLPGCPALSRPRSSISEPERLSAS